jgi:hypothetical protein
MAGKSPADCRAFSRELEGEQSKAVNAAFYPGSFWTGSIS